LAIYRASRHKARISTAADGFAEYLAREQLNDYRQTQPASLGLDLGELNGGK